MIRSPKLYLSDCGLMCWLLGLGSEADLLRSPLLGAVWETQVVAMLRIDWHFAEEADQR